MPGATQLVHTLESIAGDLQKAVDLTLRLYHDEGVTRKELGTEWEHFLKRFMDYLKTAGKAHGENLVGWINWTKLWH